MNSIDAFQKRLRDETVTVEMEIQSHNKQLEASNKRLKGLKRAVELFESEQAAIVELLQTGTANGSPFPREMPTSPAAKVQKTTTGAKAAAAHNELGRNTQIGRSKTKTEPNRRTASQNGGRTRLDMIAAVLRRHPRRTVRELRYSTKNTAGRPPRAQ